MRASTVLTSTAIATVLLAACSPGAPANTTSAASAEPVLAAPVSAAPASAAPATTGDADSAQAFLTEMYSHYGGAADPTTFTNPPAYFDPGLAAMLATDAKRTSAGMDSALDFDPICECQDAGGLKATIEVTGATADAAKAVATLRYPGPPAPDGPSKVKFDLVKINGQWRIHDTHSTDAPSLRALLARSNASHVRAD